ncbi:flagellar hook-basal body complex protein [Halarcobacter anaerophilus]|uniref:flagellar hook-basal body complex protein n=1 Tax=Halarcobacter anaerophilus TaxID=877500 RepID=UPI000698D9F7|nr:flagellar hook-basal body complex protein [Halarcobacter anaerophilus]
MIGALWTGISGLSASRAALDNESNNIANVNTVGYKASRVSFADMMYQDSIGKGASVTNAEKQYTQGSLNPTGSSYDLALDGDGFFVVSNINPTGTSETYYTRAGNLRMGENGTLQDANGYEVQGWAMSSLDPTSDIVSTNNNWRYFNDNFTEKAGNQIIQFSNRVETYAAKVTDYASTAKSDSTVLTGSGIKSQSDKISDINTLMINYQNALEDYAENPDATSSPSIAQSTLLDFPDNTNSIMDGEKDQIYTYINGDKVYAEYVNTTATTDFIEEVDLAVSNGSFTMTDLDGDGTVGGQGDYDILASRVATYKTLADEISSKTGLNAYTVNSTTNEASTAFEDVINGLVKIDSIIPGEEFTIGDVIEASGTTEVEGKSTTLSVAEKGSAEGAVISAMEALSKAISGKQQDVFSTNDLNIDGIPKNYTYSMTIYDKEAGENISVPSSDLLISNVTSIDDAAEQINANSELSKYVEAKNINGNLVVQTLNSNYDVEFSSRMEELPSIGVSLNNIVDNADYTFNINIDGTLVISSTYSPDPLINPYTTTASQIYNDIKTQINTYNLTATDKLKITPLNDGNFSIYTEDKEVSLEGSTISINGENLPVNPTGVQTPANLTVLEEGMFTITPADNTTYSLDILGETITYNSGTGATSTSIYNGIVSAINLNSNINNLVDIGSLSGNDFNISQTKIDTLSPSVTIAPLSNLSYSSSTTATVGTPEEYAFSPTLADDMSASVFTLEIDGVELKVKTDQTPTVAELGNALAGALAEESSLADKIEITNNGTDIIIREKISSQGYQGLPSTPSLTVTSLTDTGDEFNSVQYSTNENTKIEINANYSGREGAGAEFMQIVSTVEQDTSMSSLQLRLDTLGLTDQSFSEFSVDESGLITMTQDGVDFVVGQIAVAQFVNNIGLEAIGDNLLKETTKSGKAVYSTNNDNTTVIKDETLELSTADLSESLVNLMVFQRAFEANSKSITTADQLLTTLIQLKN